TVTCQYLAQDGCWDPGYDDSANPMVVGIENVTGQIGLLVSNNLRPLPGIAVRFSPPVEALIDVADVDIASVQNESSSGFILARAGSGSTPNFNLNTVVENVGNVDITFPTDVTAQVIDELGQLVYQAQVNVPTLAEGQSENIDFGVPFNPPLAGSYSYSVNISNTQDANDTNDSETAEVVVVDTTGGTALFTYASGDTADIGGGAGGGTGIGDGGGVYFDSYGYPILVTAVDVGVGFFNNGPAPTNGFRVEIYQAVDGVPAPGTLVYTRDVALEEVDALSIENGFWRRIELETPVVITEGGMYVGWIQLDEALGLLGDTEGPISRRTFEILDNNWAQNRSVNDEDYWIRALVDTRLITTSVDKQLSGLETFELYPNPTSSTFNVNLGFSSPKKVGIGIYNMMGQKMTLIQPGTVQTYEENINVSSWAPGIYLVTVQTPEGETVKRISIQ
ncbi:MAG: T9SS type A sorting domain-containing protein, partial [Bacteroidota bacterium]